MVEPNEPDIFDSLRRNGVEADDPEIRASVRTVLDHLGEVEEREGSHTARRCMEALRVVLSYQLEHPAVDDMSRFESEFDDGDNR